MKSKRILVTPLDWGLGHATRCIPIIKALLAMDCMVYVGGSGGSLKLIKSEFPQLTYFTLVGYDPQYTAQSSMVWKMTQQLFKFYACIRIEHKQIEEIVRDHAIDIVVSDNRYGCWSGDAKNIFITHQVNILVPKSIRWLSGVVNRMNYRLIKKFDQCWIPDFKDDRSMAGQLSHHINVKATYIGPLSRFNPPDNQQPFRYDIAFILSGPEPQRTVFEKLVLSQLSESVIKAIMVRGVMSGRTERKTEHNLTMMDFAESEDLAKIIGSSQLIISRSGYSTIMDLQVLGGKAFFVPTPEQTEQMYLAEVLEKKGIAGFCDQKDFDLNAVRADAQKYIGFQSRKDSTLLKDALTKLLDDGKVF